MAMTASALHSRYGAKAGARIGDLTFVGLAGERKDSGRVMGRFVCTCGSKVTLPAGRVLNGRSRQHCGCKTDPGKHRTHGMRSTPEYSSWGAMKARCLDPSNKDYPRWGGAGVQIFSGWIDSFQTFYDHIGPRPPGTTLDRINNRRGYEPGNVRWATGTEQGCNRRSSWTVEIEGHTYPSLAAAADAHGVTAMTVIRWCDGYIDARRTHQSNGGFQPPLLNCQRWRTYAA